MIRRILVLSTFLGLANLLIFLSPVAAASSGSFDPFFLFLEYNYIIAGLVLGVIMIFASYLLIKKQSEEG
ncbi:hypothetical protein [Salimicrobium flavidum]|uniref:Uncharacterized protein n=1 Tax=Salimicrobium flavidum TaxID=570947 RepID=A0A1N7IZE9_9BACI|nr:hypothetical protein [Salimicrobium flavidum]SIS42485.1 hypothetical protein SAMN05421687_10350 [Salimicrobium flavidum]